MVSGSCGWMSIGNPKSEGRFPLTSRHVSPASSVRMTSQCFCMKRVSGREGFIAIRCTQWPTSAFGSEALVDRLPALAGIVTAEGAGRRDRHKHPILALGIEDDRMQAHAAGARRPVGRGAVLAQSGELAPRLATVGGAEERGVFGAGVHGVRIGQGRFEVPDALELKGARRSVIPLMSAVLAFVGELALHGLPGLATVVRALHNLPEPAGVLRRVEPVRISWRALDVVDLPAGEVRAADIPLLAFRVRCHDEGALVRAN